MPTLIVEDGSNVINANTYIDVDYARAYASDRGVTLNADDNIVAIQIIKAMDGLLAYSSQWQGERTNLRAGVSTPQELDWPRECVYIRVSLWAKDAIPSDLKRAQAQLVIEVNNGVDLLPTTPGGDKFVTEKTVGPITTKWSEGVALQSASTPTIRVVDNLLAPMLNYGGGPTRSYRV